MPPLLKSVSIKADVEVVDEAAEDEEEDEDIATVIVQTDAGAKKVALKTSALEEKATACTMLVCYFSELQEGMFPWIQSVTELMVPLLGFIYYEEVRTAAAALMPELIKSAVASLHKGLCDAGYVGGMSGMIFDRLIKSAVEEPEPDVQLSMLEALHESLTNGGPLCLASVDKVKDTLEALKTVMGEVAERVKTRAEAQQDEDFDEEAAETQQTEAERDDDLLDQCGSALAAVTKTHKEAMAQLFQEYLEVFGALVHSPTPSHRRIGVCMFDEVLEGLEGLGQAYMPQLLPALLQFSADPSPEVRQAAVFGLGVCAQYGGAFFASMLGQVMQRIQEMMGQPDARAEEVVHSTDNAVSALAKVIEFQEEALGEQKAAAVAAFLAYLPITGDEEEGVLVHGRLCGMLERGEPVIMNEPAKWIPVVMGIFGKVVGTSTVNDEVTQRIKVILGRMQATLPAEVSQASFASIPPAEQQKLQQLLQS